MGSSVRSSVRVARTEFTLSLLDQIRFELPSGHRAIAGLSEREAQPLRFQSEKQASNYIQFGVGHIVQQTVQLRTQLLRR